MNVSNGSDQYVIRLKQCFPSLCYKKITVYLKVLVKFHKTYLILNHSFCQTSQTYLEVKGLRLEKGTRPAVGSVLRASFAALSAASFSQIPICPGTHIKIVSFLSALILCKSSCICSSRGWSVFKVFKRMQSTESLRKS